MVNFLIEPSKTALLIVDMQNVFVDGTFSPPEGFEVLDRLNYLAEYCHEVGIQVIYTAHVVRPDHNNMGILGDILPPVKAGVIDDGSVSADLHAGIRMSEGDISLKKPRYGSFQGTDLELILHRASSLSKRCDHMSAEVDQCQRRWLRATVRQSSAQAHRALFHALVDVIRGR